MEQVASAAWEGLALVFSWPNILYPIVGTILAMIVSLLPGISGATLLALAIPLTVGWEPLPIMLLFGSLVGGATFMGSISAILLNVPGRNSSAATTLDGYPMAQQGRAATAIGCSATASALGSSFGVLILILLVPLMQQVILLVGPAEFLMLVVWGLTTIVAMTRDSVLKGLAVAGIGFLVASIGFDPRTAESRYAFGSEYLRNGVSHVPIFLGLLALAELITLAASGRSTISGRTRAADLSGSRWEGSLAVFKHFGLFIRSSIIGTTVGMIPGIGGTVASFTAYGHAVQSAGRDRARFGTGDVRAASRLTRPCSSRQIRILAPSTSSGCRKRDRLPRSQSGTTSSSIN